MNYDELMRMLDIEEPEHFLYFENMADLLESEEQIDKEALCKLIRGVDKDVISELIEDYIDDVIENLPSEEADLYTLLDTIKRSLSGTAGQCVRDEGAVAVLADELLRFRKWYSGEKDVRCTEKDERLQRNVTVAEAVALYRLEKIGEKEYEYDFNDVLDYPLDEYIVGFSELLGAEYEFDEDDFMHEEDPDYDSEKYE